MVVKYRLAGPAGPAPLVGRAAGGGLRAMAGDAAAVEVTAYVQCESFEN